MFAISEYREAERAVRGRAHSWRVEQAQAADTFLRVDFPVRIESPREVGQLVDTMHEGRFEGFMDELDGIDSHDLELLVRALVRSVQFQLSELPMRTPVVPVSTMMSALALYRKIRGFQSEALNVLEIGPGCGYLAYFLSEHAKLGCYAQVESCESFYVLQSMVNRHIWGGRFLEDLQRPDPRTVFTTMQTNIDHGVDLDRHILGPPKCRHYPWWSLDRVLEECSHYEVVTSNANVNEMSREALRDYLAVFHRVLAPDGMFLVQCTGFTGHGTVEELFDVLTNDGWAPVFCAIAGTVEFPTSRGAVSRQFQLNNIVMVSEGHPLHSQAYGRANFRSGFMVEAPRVERMFFTPTGSRYTRAQVIEMVANRLRG